VTKDLTSKPLIANFAQNSPYLRSNATHDSSSIGRERDFRAGSLKTKSVQHKLAATAFNSRTRLCKKTYSTFVITASNSSKYSSANFAQNSLNLFPNVTLDSPF
ncbi:29472_t:CDS:2, partial [Racocetra persica]